MQKEYLLLKDVPNLGRKGDLVRAKPGFLRNYLVPQGYALVADVGTLRMRARLQAEREAQAIKDRQEAEAQAEQLAAIKLEVTVKVDPAGHMYGSVSVQEIQNLLEKQGVKVDKRAIQLKHALKSVGKHSIPLKLAEGVAAAIELTIAPEGGLPAVEADKAASQEAKPEEAEQG